VLEKIEKENGVQSVPSKTMADGYLIEFAKKLNAYLVTNDRLGEWVFKDEWVRKNRDRFRIAYLINGGLISLSINQQNIDFTTFKRIEDLNFVDLKQCKTRIITICAILSLSRRLGVTIKLFNSESRLIIFNISSLVNPFLRIVVDISFSYT
jgi:hypothetical protein